MISLLEGAFFLAQLSFFASQSILLGGCLLVRKSVFLTRWSVFLSRAVFARRMPSSRERVFFLLGGVFFLAERFLLGGCIPCLAEFLDLVNDFPARKRVFYCSASVFCFAECFCGSSNFSAPPIEYVNYRKRAMGLFCTLRHGFRGCSRDFSIFSTYFQTSFISFFGLFSCLLALFIEPTPCDFRELFSCFSAVFLGIF